MPERVIATLDSRQGRKAAFHFLHDVETEVILFGEAFIGVAASSDGAAMVFELRGRERPEAPPKLAKFIADMRSEDANIP